MEELVPWLWIVAIALVFWLLIIRPASRRQKQMLELQNALAVGDDVMLTSGILATIVGTTDDHLEVEIAPGVVIRVVRGAVGSVRRDEDVEAAEVDDAADADVADEAGEPGTRPDNEER
ncbi:preprotein translocase subunit YajC [Nocardioides sp. zg-536]|uniref:Preprotein translocase subunit YajC n=1 Tax=Nocardioides faecalis TaxID=2803858 RepID=A0A938Y3Y2_9ACTN|nr:preprotein translocase subunit YajC [Nocardioides faecalis]MBM9458795.1 preprotein translocase subunit YajC [Nocardioides faecalis]MBS4754112.1 preprotein translocase subunit YajC [Nocardioides faecalis]QVI60211.1 preprotein translocase subunit YajC [Nocardioides faecalis]